jgi:peptide/nickel transport system permease protein
VTRGRVALLGLVIVATLAVAAAVAPLLPLGSPTEISKDHALRAPTAAEPFGRDDLGRSVLSRVIHAYRVSLGVAVSAALLALLVGGVLGLVAGYAEGIADQLIMRPLDVLMAFPAILLAIALMSVFGTGALLVSIALAIVYTPVVARVVRAAVVAT